MHYCVYILFSSSRLRFYAGQTQEFNQRLKRHNSGAVKSTKGGIPWVKVWSIQVDSRSEAMKIENKIKKRGIKRFLQDNGIEWNRENL